MLTRPERTTRFFTTEVVGRENLAALLPEWKELSERSADDNVYFAPAYATALLKTISASENVRFLTIRDGHTLVALLPFQTSYVQWPLFGLAGLAWSTPYTFTCAPLIDRHLAYESADALITALMALRPMYWMFPRLDTKSLTAQALVAALERRLLNYSFIAPFKRAVVSRGLPFADHMKRNVASKRRRELARNRRRLSEMGSVRYVHVENAAEVEQSVEAFLSIEASGWKGKIGTALKCNADTLAFARDAFSNSCNPSHCMADVLMMDGKPIAVSLVVRSGHTGFTVKCAYDEAYRSYGVGMLLEEDALRNFLDSSSLDRLDSSTNGSHVIDGLWPERIEISDLLFSANSRIDDRSFKAVVQIELWRRLAKDGLKRLLRLGRDA